MSQIPSSKIRIRSGIMPEGKRSVSRPSSPTDDGLDGRMTCFRIGRLRVRRYDRWKDGRPARIKANRRYYYQLQLLVRRYMEILLVRRRWVAVRLWDFLTRSVGGKNRVGHVLDRRSGRRHGRTPPPVVAVRQPSRQRKGQVPPSTMVI